MKSQLSFSPEFNALLDDLRCRYPSKLFDVEGIGKQLDIVEFSKTFYGTSSKGTTADISVDANANVTGKTCIDYNFEVSKPLRKLNSLFLLWKMIKKKRGLSVANEVIERHISGDIYINDATVTDLPYCFNYSTNEIKYNGLEELVSRPRVLPPKSFAVFLRQCEQFIVFAANSSLGATGLADILIVASTFIDNIIKTGRDGHVRVDADDLWTYVKETLTSFIYTQSWSYRGNQSPFTNVSIYDRNFLESLCPDYGANIETVLRLQEVYVEIMNEEMARTPLTFPVTTACFAVDDDGNILDKAFLEYISHVNLKYGFINIYAGKTSTLSSCCFTGDTKVLVHGTDTGVKLVSLKDLYDGTQPNNLTVFHAGTWAKGKPIRLPARDMFRITTSTHKVLDVTDNHIHVTLDGDKPSSQLTTDDWLAVTPRPLDQKNPHREKLTYEQGIVVGMFAGDGTRYKRPDCEAYSVTFSINAGKKSEFVDTLADALIAWGIEKEIHVNDAGNLRSVNVYSKDLYDILGEFVTGTCASDKEFNLNLLTESLEFRQGVLDGWYLSDGGNANRIYSVSRGLIETGEVLCTSLGLHTVIDVSNRTGEFEIKGETYNRNFPLLCLRWHTPGNKTKQGDVYKFHNGVMYVRVSSISRLDYADPYVYCFEMADTEEPYFTLPCGIMTHNCRLRSDNDNPYLNTSFGAGSTKIGSLGVVTCNLPRIAIKALDSDNPLEDFIAGLHELFNLECIINDSKRSLVKKRIDGGHMPLYDCGFMELGRQYSTFGIVGFYDALALLGVDITTQEGLAYAGRVMDELNTWLNEADKKYKAPHNCEQVPGESSAVKLSQKDALLGYHKGLDGMPAMYANQFIPLTANADLLTRIRVQGSLDSKFSGGSILHINVDEELTDPTDMKRLIELAAKSGVIYFAINYLLKACKNHHIFIDGDACPTCGSPVDATFTRVVGFLVPTKAFNKTRREHDLPNRKFYHDIKV